MRAVEPTLARVGEDLLAEERWQQIISLLAARKIIRVSELAAVLGVSPRTVRRDLLKLEERGVLRRTRGGAVLRDDAGDLKGDLPFNWRAGQEGEKKARIGRAAAALIQPGDILALDAGTTVAAIVPHLPYEARLTLLTVAVNLLPELARREDLSVLVAGGILRRETLSLVGKGAEEFFRNVNIDRVFLGTSGLGAGYGATNSNIFEAEVKRAMLRAARQRVLLADSSKFGRKSLATFARPEEIHVLITDAGVPAAEVEGFRAAGVEVIIV